MANINPVMSDKIATLNFTFKISCSRKTDEELNFLKDFLNYQKHVNSTDVQKICGIVLIESIVRAKSIEEIKDIDQEFHQEHEIYHMFEHIAAHFYNQNVQYYYANLRRFTPVDSMYTFFFRVLRKEYPEKTPMEIIATMEYCRFLPENVTLDFDKTDLSMDIVNSKYMPLKTSLYNDPEVSDEICDAMIAKGVKYCGTCVKVIAFTLHRYGTDRVVNTTVPRIAVMIEGYRSSWTIELAKKGFTIIYNHAEMINGVRVVFTNTDHTIATVQELTATGLIETVCEVFTSKNDNKRMFIADGKIVLKE